jgi:hypothetical protein
LTYHDPDHNVTTTYCPKKGEIGLIKSFIHFVHYRKEIKNPINNEWLKITQDEFDQFRSNLKFTRQCGKLASLKPITITSVTRNAPSATSSSSILSQTETASVDMFKIGTKCDPSACVNQARAQDVGDPLQKLKMHLPMSWKMLLKMKMSPGL